MLVIATCIASSGAMFAPTCQSDPSSTKGDSLSSWIGVRGVILVSFSGRTIPLPPPPHPAMENASAIAGSFIKTFVSFSLSVSSRWSVTDRGCLEPETPLGFGN